MKSPFSLDVFYQPGLYLSDEAKRTLQADLCALGSVYLNPLPRYQVFDTASPTALDDKVITTIRRKKDQALIGFMSGILIPIEGLDDPVIHSGITVVHEKYRKSPVKRLLATSLFLAVLSRYPQGLWLTSPSEVIASMVQISQISLRPFPSLKWVRECGPAGPSAVHRAIAKEISAKHRSKMCISPTAQFDEERFVFLGSNDWQDGRPFMKDAEDASNQHLDAEATEYFRGLLRPGAGDEVLQVAYLDAAQAIIAQTTHSAGQRPKPDRKSEKIAPRVCSMAAKRLEENMD